MDISMLYTCIFIFVCIRVAWVFGKSVSHPVLDITPTHLSKTALSTLRQADFVAHSILKYSG